MGKKNKPYFLSEKSFGDSRFLARQGKPDGSGTIHLISSTLLRLEGMRVTAHTVKVQSKVNLHLWELV